MGIHNQSHHPYKHIVSVNKIKMKSMIVLCCCMFILTVSAHSISLQTKADDDITCPDNFGSGSIEFIPSPTDCSKYYVCVNSEPVSMSCPDGLWFDATINVCNYPANVTCGADCETPWVRPGSSVVCYSASTGEGTTFGASSKYCKSMGGILAEPRSDYEMENIVQLLDKGNNYWIGLTDTATEGQFIWKSDGSTSTYFNWAKNQPDNAGGGNNAPENDDDGNDDIDDDDNDNYGGKQQNCVQLWSKFGYKWDDKQCNKVDCGTVGPDCKILPLCQK